MKKAHDLRELRQVCKGTPLKGEELEAFFVETDHGRNKYQSTRKQIRQIIEENEYCKILFCGHRGCGKSTEINKLIEEMGDAILPVTFSAFDQMQPTIACAEDLLLVVCEQALRTAHENNVKVNSSILKTVLDYFSEVTIKTSCSRDSSISVGGAIEAGGGADIPVIGSLLKILAKVSGDIKLGSRNEQSVVRELHKRPADLLLQVNQTLRAIQSALSETKKLIIIVEDLDKMDFERAHPMFVRNVNLLSGIECSIIYTIPVWLFHSPDADSFRSKFDHSITLPMIKVTDPESPGERVEGFDIVKEIVYHRIEKEIIDDEALDHCIIKTGGVLRHVFEVLYTASAATNVSVPMQKEFIAYGLSQLTRDLRLQITLPREAIPGGPESVDELYDRLAKYAKEQKKGQKIPCTSDPINQILLKTCALVEYNGEGWFAVHPLVMDILERLDRL